MHCKLVVTLHYLISHLISLSCHDLQLALGLCEFIFQFLFCLFKSVSCCLASLQLFLGVSQLSLCGSMSVLLILQSSLCISKLLLSCSELLKLPITFDFVAMKIKMALFQ